MRKQGSCLPNWPRNLLVYTTEVRNSLGKWEGINIFNARNNIWYIGFALIAAISSGLVFSVIRLWLLGGYAPNTEIINSEIQGSWIKLIYPLLISPIIEEFMFRKGLPLLFQDFIGRKKGIIFSNIIFGIIHADLFFFPYFFNGMIYSYTYEKTKNIAVPISVHILYNLFVFLQ